MSYKLFDVFNEFSEDYNSNIFNFSTPFEETLNNNYFKLSSNTMCIGYKDETNVYLNDGTHNSTNGVYIDGDINVSGNILDINDNVMTIPIGSIIMWSLNTIPDGWLECNGQSINKTENNNRYLALFNVISHTFGGSGDNFNLPNIIDKVPYYTTSQNIGQTGGANTYTITSANIPTHNHGGSVNTSDNGSQSNITSSQNGGGNVTTTSNGGEQSITSESGGTHTHTVSQSGSHNHTFSWPYSDSRRGDGLNSYLTDNNSQDRQFQAETSVNGNHNNHQIGQESSHQHTLSITAHSHSITVSNSAHNHSFQFPTHNHNGTLNSTNYGTSSVTPINLLKPYITFKFIIKY